MRVATQFYFRSRYGRRLWPVALALLGVACTGTIAGGSAETRGAAPMGGSSAGAGPGPGQGPGSGPAPSEPDLDVGRIGIRRLNNFEYDNTVRDLLGVADTPASTFIADEKALGFDHIASALGMTEAQYEQYFGAADALVDRALADARLRARILVCTDESDPACLVRIIEAFGTRAYRRPLQADERDALVQLAADARALGENFEGAIAQTCKAMLSSAPFLYRLELDPMPAAQAPRALDGYELASRLSYLMWSSMPDEALFEAAASGELQSDAGLLGHLRRLLADERSDAFIESFAGQWLGLRDLRSHRANPDVFGAWDDGLRDAMIAEGFAFFTEFLRDDRPLTEFFTADINFVDARLAELYGIDAEGAGAGIVQVGAHQLQRVEHTNDARRGWLGLASFLTLTSFSHRTAPTLRGKWVLENLLCEEIQPPPANVPEFDEEPAGGGDLEALNVRDRLALHRQSPDCAGCHEILDPIGLGLEGFDGIGRFRTEYGGHDPIDASGELPDGTSFDGLLELSEVLARDPRALPCASERLLTYTLARELTAADHAHLDAILSTWQEQPTLRALLEAIVLSDLFRFRRGAP